MRRYLFFALFFLSITDTLAAAPPMVEVIPTPAPAPPLRAWSTTRQLSPQERAAEIARLRYLRYRRIEYPLRMNQLDDEIQIAERELCALDRQIDEYERITQPYSHPFLVTLESAKMRRLAIELRLKNLRQEKLLLTENFRSDRRLRRLEIEDGER
jgi:hypothetical protein